MGGRINAIPAASIMNIVESPEMKPTEIPNAAIRGQFAHNGRIVLAVDLSFMEEKVVSPENKAA